MVSHTQRICALLAVFAAAASIWCKKEAVYSKYYQVTADMLMVREKPDMRSAVIAKAPRGARLELVESAGKAEIISGTWAPWFKVKTDEGKTGYAFSGFLKEYGAAPAENTADPDIYRTWSLYPDCPTNAITFRRDGTYKWVECYNDANDKEIVSEWEGTYTREGGALKVRKKDGTSDMYAIDRQGGKIVIRKEAFVFHSDFH